MLPRTRPVTCTFYFLSKRPQKRKERTSLGDLWPKGRGRKTSCRDVPNRGGGSGTAVCRQGPRGCPVTHAVPLPLPNAAALGPASGITEATRTESCPWEPPQDELQRDPHLSLPQGCIPRDSALPGRRGHPLCRPVCASFFTRVSFQLCKCQPSPSRSPTSVQGPQELVPRDREARPPSGRGP